MIERFYLLDQLYSVGKTVEDLHGGILGLGLSTLESSVLNFARLNCSWPGRFTDRMASPQNSFSACMLWSFIHCFRYMPFVNED